MSDSTADCETPQSSILLRSLHRLVAVVDGSLTEKLNKTAVRLWTEPTVTVSRGN